MKKLLLPIALIIFSITVSADDIWSATVRGDKQAVQKFLNNGVSIESKRNGGTPLWYAASYAGSRKEEMIRFIVSKGGNLNAKYEGKKIDNGQGMSASNDWTTILHHFATKNNSYSIFKLLLQLGANPDILNWEGKPPLFYVKEIRHVDVLLNNGANINFSRHSSYTPLLYHAEYSRSDVIPMHLILKGADITITMGNGSNLAHVAAANNHAGIIEYLVNKKYDLEKLTKYNESPLLLAIKRGSNDAAYKLILSGVNLGINKNTSKLPLLEACYEIEKNENIIELLLLKGVSINQKNIYGTSALHILSHKSKYNEEAFKLLKRFIAEGANVNAISTKINLGANDTNGTPLDVAEPGTKGYNLLIDSGALTRVGLVNKRISDLEKEVAELTSKLNKSTPTIDEWPRKMWEINLSHRVDNMWRPENGFDKSVTLEINTSKGTTYLWVTSDGRHLEIENANSGSVIYLSNLNLIYRKTNQLVVGLFRRGEDIIERTFEKPNISNVGRQSVDQPVVQVTWEGSTITGWDFTPPNLASTDKEGGNNGGNTARSRLSIGTSGPDISIAADGKLGGPAELQKSNDLKNWRKLGDVPADGGELLITPRDNGNEFFRLRKKE